jgi:hypothetical protein
MNAVYADNTTNTTTTIYGPCTLPYNCKGLHLVVNITAGISATDTISVLIEGVTNALTTDVKYDLLQSDVYTTTGIKVLKVYPTVLGVAGSRASDTIPDTFYVKVTHATATPITYSLTANFLN